MTTGELARETGVTTRTIRYYEEKGFIRRHGQHFSKEALVTLQKIKLLQEAGLRLDEIATVFREINGAPTTDKIRQKECQQLLRSVRQKFQQKVDMLNELTGHIDEVINLGATCDTCTAEECEGCSRLHKWESFGYERGEG